jgi:hypothetical protein
VRLVLVVFVLYPHYGYRLPPVSTNAAHDPRRERLTTITRLLFPSHEIAAIEWLSNIRELRSLAAARFNGDTAETLRWLAPALVELTPDALLFAIRTRMPLEATPATSHLAERITAISAHFFPGLSEYIAYLWLNDVAKLAELARLVREDDLPATFDWIAPAMELAAELRTAARRPFMPTPESEEQPLEAWKEDMCVWRDEFAAWQRAQHVDCGTHRGRPRGIRLAGLGRWREDVDPPHAPTYIEHPETEPSKSPLPTVLNPRDRSVSGRHRPGTDVGDEPRQPQTTVGPPAVRHATSSRRPPTIINAPEPFVEHEDRGSVDDDYTPPPETRPQTGSFHLFREYVNPG